MSPKDQIPRMVEEMAALFRTPRRKKMADPGREEIDFRFRFHAATAITKPKHEEVREKVRKVALWVLDNVPDSRERSLALTSLQEAMMWCNAAIAIHTEPEPDRVGADSS